MKTPAHTVRALEVAIAAAKPVHDRTGAKFVNIDTRVLEWLLADWRALNTIPDATPAGAVVAETSGVAAGETA